MYSQHTTAFIPEDQPFLVAFTGPSAKPPMNEQQTSYHSVNQGPISMDRIPVRKGFTLPSAAGPMQAGSPLFIYRTETGVFVNCAKIISSAVSYRRNSFYHIDRVLDPQSGDFEKAKKGQCKR
jgi:hypothetical protein